MMLFPKLNDDLSLSGMRPNDYPDAKSSYTCCVCKDDFPPEGVFYSGASYDADGLYIWGGADVVAVCDICVYEAMVKRGQRKTAEMEKTARGRATLAKLRKETAT